MKILMQTFGLTTDHKKYAIEFRSVQLCSQNVIIYHVITDKIKHDVREEITFEKIIELYETK